jgi:kynurenine 3-monooxygenase
MRHDVTTWSFLFRKAVDNVLYGLTAGRPAESPSIPISTTNDPRGWLPLYTMVTFRPDIGYATAKRKAERQGRIVSVVGVITLMVGGTLAWQRWRNR